MPKLTTLHLGDSDMIVFLNLIDRKLEILRRELISKGLTSSPELEELKALKAQLESGKRDITSFNSFDPRFR